MRNKLRRPLAFLLSAVMIVTMSGTPVHAVADRGQPETGLCEHHTAHTDDCGYTEETPGTPCGHEHTEDCYTEVTECVHEHTPECYPEETEDSVSGSEATPANAEKREPENCPHICDGESGCITEKLDCRHEHDSECGYTESTPGTPCTYVCEICNPQDSGEADEEPETGIIKQEQCSCLTLCTEGQINPDCPVCGAEDAGLSDCKGKAEKEDTKQPEDTGICKHHQEHDDACGYQPESEDSEGSPCTYECRICPIEDLIATLPDKVTEDNADEVRAQLDEILALYRELTGDEQEQIDLSRVYELQGALDEANDPTPLSTGDVDLCSTNTVTLTEAECSGGCQGHKITQSYTQIVRAKILVESGTHNITFSGLNLSPAAVGIMPGGTMNLTLVGTNKIVGSGRGFYVPVGATLVITEQSTGSLDISLGSYATAAGIGGAYYDPNGNDGDFSCGMVVINGGTITAAGRGDSAGIGGASYAPNFGNGGNITITGGHVTATGSDGAPAIGGVKDADSDGSLTLSAADVLAENTTLGAKGTYTINGDPTEDMIVVPELVYTGEILDTSEIRIDDSKTGTATYFGQTFRVQASADGWVLQDLGEVKEGGEYTAVFKKDNKEISKTFTVAQSGTQFVGDGTVKTYKDGTECSDFTADDTITVKATPTATGEAPANSAMFAASFTGPGAGQMAVFVGNTQVSEAVDAGTDGSYAIAVKAADVLEQGNVEPNGDPITLTAKFVGNNNMADAAGTVNINISAVAKVEKYGSTTYVGNLEDAFKTENDGATITLLANVTRTEYLLISIDCILDLGGHTITCTGGKAVSTFGQANVTIQGAGEVVSASGTALDVGGNVTLKGGTFTGGGSQCAGVNVNDGSGSLSVTENVTIQNTGGGYGLAVSNAQSVQLSGGKYSGTAGAIVIVSQSSSLTLGGLLAHSGDTRYAYFDESGTTPFTGVLGNKSLTGTVTVKKCNHTGEGVCEYTHATSTTTHQQTCLACGKKWDEENCSYTDSRCACGSTLSVALAGTERLIYDGNPREPGVTVTLDGTKLAETDYGVTYANNINAGTDTATVTVKGKENYSFEIKKTFSIEKAEQKDFAATAVTTQYEKNGTFILSTTGGSGDGAVLYRVPENNGVLMVNGDQATIIGVGTVAVTATKAESDNYKAATATGKITIEKAPAPAITYPTAGSIAYGQKLSDSALTGGSTEYGTFAWENGSMVPAVDNTGYTVVFTASGETKKNYETIIDTTQKVSVKVEKAVPAVSITAAVSGSKDDRQSAITVNVAKAGAGDFPTGTVTFIDCTGSTEVEIGAATLSNGTASYTWDGLLDKTYTIKAVYAGDSNYKEAVSREFTFDAAKQNQQDFALDAIGAKTYGDAAVTLKTTGGNGSGAVRYESSDEDVIRIEDGRAVIVGAGTATITAIKEGDDKYNEASAGRNVTVAKKALTVRADSKTVVRGNPMPAFTYRADGLVNGDTFTTAPSITAGVQNTDTLGKYDIVINGGTLRNSESYHITYVNGTLKIVERFYTVTVTDGTGGGEYAEGDTVTVTANDRSGYTFTGWSSEDGVGFADSKAKTTTFTMPAKSVTVKANYTRNSSGGNNGGGSGDGGNSGGSGNNGGGNSADNGNNGGGGSTNPGNGNTTPQPFVTPSTETSTNPGNEIAPGTGTTPVNPGSGNTSRPGTTPGSGSAGMPSQGTKQPFIKGADGKIGWDVIRAEEENAEEGSVINVDMNGSTVVPGDIFDSIKGKDITITFDMGSGILWSVDGKNITTDKAGDIDFSVKTGVKTVPVDIINNVTGENYSIQISLAYEGEFGFTAVLSINFGKENAGYTASLYYYNESTGELEFICKDQIAEDGTVSLAFTHASDYVIAIDGEQEEGDGAAEPIQPEGTDGEAGDGTAENSSVPENPGTGQTGAVWWIMIVILLLTAAIGAGVFVAVKKKGKDENGRQ